MMKTKTGNTIKSTLALTLAAFIWGMGFVAQRSGMEYVGPFFFSGARMLLGAITIAGVTAAGGARTRGKTGIPFARLVKGGVAAGGVLFLAGNFQQVGLVVTTASKAGFLTALYIVLVPILGMFLKHKTHWNTWVSVLIAAVGLYFLCITANLDISAGDFIVLIGALFWAVHILVINHCVQGLTQTEVMKLCVFQFMTSGILSLICALFFDGFFVSGTFDGADVLKVMPAILYAGVLSAGAGFTLQAVGQKYANPSAASIIMSLEAVFSVVGGFLILDERFTGREIFGCILMFAAVLLAQIPVANKVPAGSRQ
ncbi:MAG: DMT family transporter [Clostridiales Family XIII bacterium]|nr:DMT family transporter [Clostridiales Family XIII bacterium]